MTTVLEEKEFKDINQVDAFNSIAELGADIERVENGNDVIVVIKWQGKVYQGFFTEMYKLAWYFMRDYHVWRVNQLLKEGKN